MIILLKNPITQIKINSKNFVYKISVHTYNLSHTIVDFVGLCPTRLKGFTPSYIYSLVIIPFPRSNIWIESLNFTRMHFLACFNPSMPILLFLVIKISSSKVGIDFTVISFFFLISGLMAGKLNCSNDWYFFNPGNSVGFCGWNVDFLFTELICGRISTKFRKADGRTYPTVLTDLRVSFLPSSITGSKLSILNLFLCIFKNWFIYYFVIQFFIVNKFHHLLSQIWIRK